MNAFAANWLAVLGLSLTLGLAPAALGADKAEVLYEAQTNTPAAAAKQEANGPLVAAKVDPLIKGVKEGQATPDSVPVVSDGGLPAAPQPEAISIISEENRKLVESDELTRQALSKLDEPIEESMVFVNTDLQNVIRMLGKRMDINFIFDSADINGKVTMSLQNIRLRDALDSILSSRKLAIVADHSGIFRIVPQERVGRKLVETKTEVIQLRWISAVDLAKTMEPFLTEAGTLKANEESNSLIVTDVPPQIVVIRDLIDKIDLPERQVVIEARLVDINIGAAKELGTKWSVQQTDTKTKTKSAFLDQHALRTRRSFSTDASGNITEKIEQVLGTGSGSVVGDQTIVRDASGNIVSRIDNLVDIKNILANPGVTYASQQVVEKLAQGFDFTGGRGTLSFGQKVGIFGGEYDLNAVFTALERRNVVEVLANPRVTTLNNVPANIKILEKIPYVQASGASSSGTQIPTIEFEKAGVEIQAKPIITPDGFVRLEIQLKQMIFRERVGGGALDPPAIDEREANTNVIVQDQNTVVLGGLRQVRKLEGIDGVPWLHRIPLLGWLFKDKNYDQSKTELVLMMTPRIIRDKANLTDHETKLYNKIDANWHLPDYFFDDVKSSDDTLDGAAKKKKAEAAPAAEKKS